MKDGKAAYQRARTILFVLLAPMVGEVRTGVDAFTTASAQIAGGHQDLCSRTEEPASSLQATASSMEQISARSQRIADIIGTIDGIAFPTNIPALNAVVEAARAGEQGRGFAVVAGGVRRLARRSAEAARVIKRLITDSVEKVGAGSRLVDNAGPSMRDIVNQVRRRGGRRLDDVLTTPRGAILNREEHGRSAARHPG